MAIDITAVVKEVIQFIQEVPKDTLAGSLVGGEYKVSTNKYHMAVSSTRCKIGNAEAEVTITDATALAEISKVLAEKLGQSPFTGLAGEKLFSRQAQQRVLDESGIPANFRIDSGDLSQIPGLIRVDEIGVEKLQELTNNMMKPHYSHEEIYGKFCFLGEHINVPYDVAFEYAANVHSLPEWTLSLRNLRHLGGGLYRGTEAIESQDTSQPNTEIFIRADSMRGPEHGLILYPCSWDQGYELWMRYYFILIDSQKTLNKPGTVVLWINCKHPYYDRNYKNVPSYIEQGQARTDRQWVGDLWDAFYPLHYFEMNNLKRILEYRFAARTTMP